MRERLQQRPVNRRTITVQNADETAHATRLSLRRLVVRRSKGDCFGRHSNTFDPYGFPATAGPMSGRDATRRVRIAPRLVRYFTVRLREQQPRTQEVS